MAVYFRSRMWSVSYTHLDVYKRQVEDAYLFGPDLYVAPVMEDHGTEREVYLPAGTASFNAWTGEKYEGGQNVTVAAPMDTIPVFVKEGADTEHLLNIFSE